MTGKAAFANVLIPSGGKWVGIVLQLRRAMREVEALRDGRLFVADRAELTPAGCFADAAFVVPPIDDPQYVENLLRLCSNERVRVVVPLIDRDVVRLAGSLEAFTSIGTTVVCPPAELVELCFDKSRFYAFALEQGLPHPAVHDSEAIEDRHLPVFAKPRWGFGSTGTRLCRSMQDVRVMAQEGKDVLFQEYVEAPEVSVDAYVSTVGSCTVRVQRVRDKVIGGEAVQSHTIKSPAVRELAARAIEDLAKRSLRGPLNLQLFAAEKPTIIEVNTRLGSGSVLSNMATQGRFFRSILAEACGEICLGDPEDYLEDRLLYRYWGDVFHDGSKALDIVPGRDA